MANQINCPNCQTQISVNEVLQSQLSERIRTEIESELRGKENDLRKAQSELTEQRTQLKQQEEGIANQIKAGIDSQRDAVMAKARTLAEEAIGVELKDRTLQIEELESKLRKANTNELELRKQERELKAQKEELELSVARKLDAERDKIREGALKQAADERQLKDDEQKKVISELNRQIDDLKRKAQQGCVQSQGEVLEIALESMLESTFPSDSVEPVGKGVNGADNKHVVRNSSGVACGSILWEAKRTKSFSKAWLSKLRDDQRAARASVAVIVTQAMPEGVDTFTRIDGVWVCSWQCAKGLAMALRAGLIEVGKNQLASEGRVEKMEVVYNYLSSNEFLRCVEGIVEAFVTMQTDLETEKRSMTRLWNKREKQIDRAINNTASLYGDLQGIIGASMPVIDGLSVDKLIEAPAETSALTAK